MTKIGMQVSSIETLLQTPEAVFASFRKISEIGYKSVQIQWISADVPMTDVHHALMEANLGCVGTQDYYDAVIANLDKVIAMNDLWHGTYICVSGLPERYHSLQGCLAFAGELSKLSEQLKRIGKILTFHPRAHDILHYGRKSTLDIIFENTGGDLQFNLDVIGAGVLDTRF